MANKKPSISSPIKKNKFPFTASSQILFDFAEELIRTKKLDKVSAKKLEEVLKKYRGLTEKKLESFLISVTPKVRTTLRRAYNQYLSGGYAERNLKIKPYKLRDLAPSFRRELDNHVVNSLALIKTQNMQTMYKLEKTFRNWATVPAKELRASLTDPVKITSNLKKEIINDKELRYQNERHLRFILKDQTNKLNSAMDKITADNLGAIGFIWRNSRDQRVVGNPGGLYPEVSNPKVHGNHYEREGKLYLYKDSWALKNGYIAPRAGVSFSDSIQDGMPGIPIGCRCYAESIYNLEDIPTKFHAIITKKGQEFLDKL